VKTIRKVGTILRHFSVYAPEHTLTDLSKVLGASVSGTFDIVDGLREIGLLTKVGRGRYRLGPLVSSMNAVLDDTTPVAEAARAVLDHLSEEYGETVHLTQQDNGRLLVLGARDGRRTLNVARSAIGPQLELGDCAPGWLHLAAMDEDQRQGLRDRHQGGRNWPKDDVLAHVFSDGYVAGPLKTDTDVVCTAALIRNHAALSAGVVGLAVPASRYEKEPRAYKSITMRAARDISAKLGFVAD
jgi:DNA-binding IclR family transcriptional regulator